jgi:glucokinase
MKHVIGLDIGGTNIKAIIVDSAGNSITEIRIPTVDDGTNSWIVNVETAAAELITSFSGEILAIGIAAPGLPNNENTCIAHLPNRLNGLEGLIWQDLLKSKTFVINDAHAATYAEKAFGVAKDIENFILLTLGTGVGGGIVINGKLVQGLSQMAGHLGHTLVNDSDTEKSILGMPGSLEYAIGNYSVEKRSAGRFKSTFELVEAHKSGDYFATHLWLTSINKLALSMCSMINMLSPQAIVLAGGITKAGPELYEPLNAFLDVHEFRPSGKKTNILQAEFDDLSGAIGAAGFAFGNLENNKYVVNKNLP